MVDTMTQCIAKIKEEEGEAAWTGKPPKFLLNIGLIRMNILMLDTRNVETNEGCTYVHLKNLF